MPYKVVKRVYKCSLILYIHAPVRTSYVHVRMCIGAGAVQTSKRVYKVVIGL